MRPSGTCLLRSGQLVAIGIRKTGILRFDDGFRWNIRRDVLLNKFLQALLFFLCRAAFNFFEGTFHGSLICLLLCYRFFLCPRLAFLFCKCFLLGSFAFS